MLVDDLNEQLANGVDVMHAGKESHFDVLRRFAARIGDAALYDLQRDAVAMCAHVGLGKPSSVLAALSHLRLPAPSIWIEWTGADIHQAMADAGSPNNPSPGSSYVIERAGFLVWRDGGDLRFEYLSRSRAPDGRRAVDAAPVLGSFVLGAMPASAQRLDVVSGDDVRMTTGRLRDHLRLVNRDPTQSAAQRELVNRCVLAPHPDFGAVMRAAHAAGVDVDDVLLRQAADARRLFDLMVLPALVLLNCRNAVAVEREPAPERLNKARAKAGRAPIRERHLVRLSLTTRQGARAKAAGDGGRALRASLVIGHFKVRASGVFWWHHHARAGWGTPAQVVRKVVA